MDRLWSPWRMDYIQNKEDNKKGCVFCLKSKQKDDRDNLVLFRGLSSFVVMNLYPYNNGHIMICPYSHIDSTKSLSKESMAEPAAGRQRFLNCSRIIHRYFSS